MRYRHGFSEELSPKALRDAEAKRSFNERLFDVVALRYDVVTRLLSFGWDQRWKKRLIRRIGRRSVERGLDVASGTGDITRRLARRYPGAEVIGIDLSGEMLRRARRLTQEANVRYLAADMAHMPFEDVTVDLVTGGYALRNAPDVPAVLRELRRVVRPGARLAFLDFSHTTANRLRLLRFWGWLWGYLLNRNPTTYGYIADSLAEYPHPDELISLFRRAGFRNVKRLPLLFGFMELLEGSA